MEDEKTPFVPVSMEKFIEWTKEATMHELDTPEKVIQILQTCPLFPTAVPAVPAEGCNCYSSSSKEKPSDIPSVLLASVKLACMSGLLHDEIKFQQQDETRFVPSETMYLWLTKEKEQVDAKEMDQSLEGISTFSLLQTIQNMIKKYPAFNTGESSGKMLIQLWRRFLTRLDEKDMAIVKYFDLTPLLLQDLLHCELVSQAASFFDEINLKKMRSSKRDFLWILMQLSSHLNVEENKDKKELVIKMYEKLLQGVDPQFSAQDLEPILIKIKDFQALYQMTYALIAHNVVQE
jgi:hypothetical protein